MNVIPLAQPDPGTVRMLEDMLEDAKAGRLRGLAAMVLYEGRRADNVWCGEIDENVFLALGGLSVLHAELMQEMVEGL